MGVNFEIEHTNGITIITFNKKPNMEEAIAAMDAVATENIERRLWHFKSGFVYTSEELKTIAEYGKLKWPSTSKVALVTPDKVGNAVMKLLSQYIYTFRKREDYETKVFRDKKEALSWLDE